MRRIALSIVLSLAASVSVWGQAGFTQAPRIKNLCDSPSTVTADQPVPVAPPDCTVRLSPSVQGPLGRAEAHRVAGRTADARAETASALAAAAAQSGRVADVRSMPPPTKCPVDNTVYVKPSSAQGANDALAVAREAQLLGDDATANAALRQAGAAYRDWAEQIIRTSATTVGDYVAIARGAQLFGLDDLSKTALDNAREVARANLHRAGVGSGDECALDDEGRDCRQRAIATALWLGVDDAGERADLQSALKDMQKPCFAEWFGTIIVTITDGVHTKEGPDSRGTSSTYDMTNTHRIEIAIPESGPAVFTMSGEGSSTSVTTDPGAGNTETIRWSAVCRGTDRRDSYGIVAWSDERGDYTIDIPAVTPTCRTTWDATCTGACGRDHTPVHVAGDEVGSWMILGEVSGRAATTATSLTGSRSFDLPNSSTMTKESVQWSLTRRKKPSSS